MSYKNNSISVFGFLSIFFVMSVFFLPISTPAKTQKTEQKSNGKDVLDSNFIRKITKRQGRRLDKINQYKKKGHLGENTLGLLSLRTAVGLSQKEAQSLKNIMQIENKDREKIYKIIIETSHYNKEQEKILRQSMFLSRFEMDPVGTYYYQETYWQKK